MIEFFLYFGLGFLAAALLMLIFAPAIHGRIVHYTENRIKATLPISPQELRAQRDMIRAVHAAENARGEQELRRQRQLSGELRLLNESLTEEAQRLHSGRADLRARIAAMDIEAAEARARLRRENSLAETLKAALDDAEAAIAERDEEIEKLKLRQSKTRWDADKLRSGLSDRDRETENLRARIATLSEERTGLREDLRRQTQLAGDARNRLSLEEERVARLEKKLAIEISERTDKEEALERRLREIERLRQRLEAADLGMRSASAPFSPPAAASPPAADNRPTAAPKPVAGGDNDDAAEDNEALRRLSEEMHERAARFSQRLADRNGDESGSDEELRGELTQLAAGMVALTALKEGPASPIHALLAPAATAELPENLAILSRKAIETAAR